MRFAAAIRRPGEFDASQRAAHSGEQPGSPFVSPTIGQLPGPHGASGFAIGTKANPQASLSLSAAPAPPAIHYHIERLVLDGLPLDAQQKQVLASALEQELGSLLQHAHASRNAADPQNYPASGAMGRLSAAPVTFGQPCDARDLGQQIARSIHAGVQGSGHTPPDSLSRSTKP